MQGLEQWHHVLLRLGQARRRVGVCMVHALVRGKQEHPHLAQQTHKAAHQGRGPGVWVQQALSNTANTRDCSAHLQSPALELGSIRSLA